MHICIQCPPIDINPLWCSDTIWQYRSGSTLFRATITWTSVAFSIVRFSGVRLYKNNFTASGQATFIIMSLKVIFLKLLPHLPRVNHCTTLYISHLSNFKSSQPLHVLACEAILSIKFHFSGCCDYNMIITWIITWLAFLKLGHGLVIMSHRKLCDVIILP